MSTPFTSLIIAAAGSSARFGTEDKLFCDLCGAPVAAYSLAAAQKTPEISEIIICAAGGLLSRFSRLAELCAADKVKAVVKGGATRQLSVRAALEHVSPEAEFIAVHDCARPLASCALFTRVCLDAYAYGAAVPALPLCDTVKRVKDGKVLATVPREGLAAVQTPQVFAADAYRQAVRSAGDASFTDDSQLFEAAGRQVHITPGDPRNIKITYRSDMETARALLNGGVNRMRIGHGYDLHLLKEGRKLILCGTRIPFEKGLAGHSDADAAAHALIDAILGAAALGDIGKLFPDTDPAYEGADSLMLLRRTVKLAEEKGFAVVNADVTVVAQRPRLSPYVEKMRSNLADACGVSAERISVKATTEEGAGATGSGDAVSSFAVVLLEERAIRDFFPSSAL